MMARTPGRRPGGANTRAEIVGHARELFGELGFEQATVRRIARAADVDPALVTHYFGSKEALFREAMALPIDIEALAARVFGPGRAGAGERLAEAYLETWETEPAGAAARGVLRAAASHEAAAQQVRGMIEKFAGRLAPTGPVRRLGIEMAGAHLIGLAMARYILKVEPLASATRQEVAAIAGPLLDQYLWGKEEEEHD